MRVEALRELLDGPDADGFGTLGEIVELRALMDRLEARWLTALATADRAGAPKEATGLATSEWLAQRCRMTGVEARATVTLARRLAATEVVGPAFASGRLSAAQARVLVRARTKRTAELFDDAEAMLVELVGDQHVDLAELIVGQWYRRADAATAHADATDASARRELHLASVGDSEWFLKATLTAEQGEVVNEAISALVQAMWEREGETRTLAQRRADALAALSRAWLDNQQQVTIHGERPHVHVHIDADDLLATFAGTDSDSDCDSDCDCDSDGDTDEDGDGADHVPAAVGPEHAAVERTRPAITGTTNSGMHLDAATVERLLCDCILSRVLLADSVILDAGRPSRTIPAALRRAIIDRDRHCRYPGCRRPPSHCDVHHVTPWSHGGTHTLAGCILLCGRDHDRVHRLGERLTLDPDGTLTVTTASGHVATSRPANAPPRDRPPTRDTDPQRLARQRAAMLDALHDLRNAASWTTERDNTHNTTHNAARARLRALLTAAREPDPATLPLTG